MSLTTGQSGFASALLDPASPVPPGLRTWNGSDPEQRFGIYRNNVVVSLIEALADTFPVTKALVGKAFFQNMARVYACIHPPVSRVMARYGDGFPGFIEKYPPASPLPYLSDVARLEFQRVESFHAADADALNAEDIAAVLSDETSLPELSFEFHPSLRCIDSPFAIVSLWAAHQGLLELSEVFPEQAESAMVLRVGLEVEIYGIEASAVALIRDLESGMAVGKALSKLATEHPDFEPSAILALLIQKGAITGLKLQRSQP